MANPPPSHIEFIEISDDDGEQLQAAEDQHADLPINDDQEVDDEFEDEEIEEDDDGFDDDDDDDDDDDNDDDEEDEDEEEDDDEGEAQIDPDYAVFLAEVESSRAAQNAAEVADETETRDGAAGTTSFAGIGGAEGSQGGGGWNRGQMDGLFCPICLDAWTNDGDHHICCLPCGHIFGLSCITKWLQRKNVGKCPQCNTKCKLKDVRKLFASRVVSIDEETEKRFKSLEAKFGFLAEKVAGLCKKEAKLKQKVQKLEKPSVDAAKICQLIEARFDALDKRMDVRQANIIGQFDDLKQVMKAIFERLQQCELQFPGLTQDIVEIVNKPLPHFPEDDPPS